MTRQLTRCDVLEPESGHISMLVGKRAPHILWEPVKLWIEAKF